MTGRGPNYTPQRGAPIGGFTPSRPRGGQNIIVTIGPHAGKGPQSYRFPLSGQIDSTLGSFNPAKARPVDSEAQRQLQLRQQFYKAQEAIRIADNLDRQYRAGPGATTGFGGFAADFMPTAQNRKYNRLWRTVDEVGSPLIGKYYKVPAGTSAWTQDDIQLQRITDFRNGAIAARDDAIKQLGGVPDGRGGLVGPPRAAGAPLLGQRPSGTSTAIDQSIEGSRRTSRMVSSGPTAQSTPGITQQQAMRPLASEQPPQIEPATGQTRDEIDEGLTAQVSAAIRAGMSYENIQKYWPSRDFTLDKYNTAVKHHEEYPGYKGPLVRVLRTVPNSEWNRIVNGPVGAFTLSEVKSLIPLRPFLSKQQQTELDMILEANPGWAAAGGLTGELVNSYTLGPLYESGLGLVAPKLGEKAISLTAETSMGALKGALDAKDGEGGWGALTGGFGGLVKGWRTYKAKRYLDELALGRLENLPRLNNFLTDHLVPTMVSGLYDAGAEQLKTPSAPPTLEDVTDDQSGKMEGGTPATVLQSTPGSSSPANLYAQSMSSHFRSNVQPAPRQSYQPTPFAVPTAEQGTADFYAQLGDLKRNADAMATGPYPNPGDAARAAQLVEPRPVYPTNHPYGFGAGFAPDQVASGRPYAVAPQAAAVPADDQGTIVYRTQPPTYHRYGAQPGVGLYGDAGGYAHYGLSYDHGAGGYVHDGSDGFDFASPAYVHAGGWQHPADALGQGAGLLVAAPGARFGYGGAAPAPVIGGFIPLGLGAAARSDGSGGGSDSVPLYSSYNNNGGGDWGAQPDVSIVPDPSGWSPRSAVRSILAIAPDDGQGPPNWLEPNAPPPQIMLNIPDLSGLIR